MRDCVSHSQGQEQGPWAARTMWFIVTSWGSFQNVKSSNGEPAKTRGPPKLLLPSLWETPCPKATAVTGLSPALQTAQEPSFPPFVSLPAVTRWKAAFPLASQDGQEDARLSWAQVFGKMFYLSSCRQRSHCRPAEGYLFIPTFRLSLFPVL